MESRELWKGFLYSVIDVMIHFLNTFIPLSVSLLCCLINVLPSGSITAECPVLSHVAAGPTADAEGGGGQREVQEKNSYPHACSSLTPLRAFSGRDPTVSTTPLCFIGGL